MSSTTLLAEYGTYHRDPRNRICHEIGIPLIVASSFTFLGLLKIGPANSGALVGAAVLAYYAFVNIRLALIAAVAFVALYALGNVMIWPLAIAAFAAGWVLQFVGHKFEGKSPAFLKNGLHLLIGPLWIVSMLFQQKTKSSA